MRREDFFLVVSLSSKLKNYQVLNKKYYKQYLWNNTGKVSSKLNYDFMWPVNLEGKKSKKSKVAIAPRVYRKFRPMTLKYVRKCTPLYASYF